MKSFVAATCLLATFAFASPAEVQGRYQDSNSIAEGYSSSEFSQSSSSAYSTTTTLNSFTNIGNQIGRMQDLLAQGTLTQELARQQAQQLATTFHDALTQASSCGGCYVQNTFSANLSQVFQQFTQLISSLQNKFGGGFSQICSPFTSGSIQSSFKTFFNSAYNRGLILNNIIPNNFYQVMTPIMPSVCTSLSGLGFK